MDEVRRIASNLTHTILTMQNQEVGKQRRRVVSLKQLSDIFRGEVETVEDNDALRPQTSSTSTTHQAFRVAPRTHGQKMRNNTPGMLPP